MQHIEDLEHFVLAPGETLILRCKKHITQEQLENLRGKLREHLPGRPVMVLPPDMEVFAGELEIIGAPQQLPENDEDTRQAEREAIERAYENGRSIWCKEAAEGTDWFMVHRYASPITEFAWELYDYRLTKPAPGK